MPNKPAKYRIKINALVEVRTYYVLNIVEPYIDQQTEYRFRVSNSPRDIVDRIVAPISGTNRNINFGN